MDKSRRQGRRTAAALGAGLVLVAAGCGSAANSAQPTTNFFSGGRANTAAHASRVHVATAGPSFQGLFGGPGLQVTLSLGVTTASAESAAQLGGGSLTPAQATALATGSVVIDLHTTNGSSLSQAWAEESAHPDGSIPIAEDVSLHIGTDVPVDVRSVGQTLYLQVDAAQLLRDVGQNPAEATAFERALAQGNAIVPGLAALGQGKWVSTDAAQLRRLETQNGVPSATAGSSQLLAALAQAFDRNVTWTSSGTVGGRQGYVATVAVEPLLDQALAAAGTALGPMVPSLQQQVSAARSMLSEAVPVHMKVVLQVFAVHGVIDEIDLNLSQFTHQLTIPIPLRLVLTPGTAVSAPAGATSLDLTPVLSPLLSRLHQGLTQRTT